MDVSDLLTGEGSVWLQDVVATILEAPSFSGDAFLQNWKSFAGHLGLSEEIILQLQESIVSKSNEKDGNNKSRAEEILKDTIEAWIEKNEMNATLDILGEAIVACGFDGIKDILTNKFSQPEQPIKMWLFEISESDEEENIGLNGSRDKDLEESMNSNICRDDLQESFDKYKLLVDLKFNVISEDKKEKYMKYHNLIAVYQLVPEWLDKFLPFFQGHESIDIDEDLIYKMDFLERDYAKVAFHKFKDSALAKFMLAEFVVKNLTHPDILRFLTRQHPQKERIMVQNWKKSYVDQVDPVWVYFVDTHLQQNPVDYNLLLESLRDLDITVPELMAIAAICCIHKLENCLNLMRRLLLDRNRSRDDDPQWFELLPKSENAATLIFTNPERKMNLEAHLDALERALSNFETKNNPTCDTILSLLHKCGKEMHAKSVLFSSVSHTAKCSDFEIDLGLKSFDNLVKQTPAEWWKLQKSRNPLLFSGVHVKLLQQMVECGANINACSPEDGTILHGAAWGGYECEENFKKVVQWALSEGFRGINARDRLGRTCLMVAIQEYQTLDDEVLQMFFDARAEFDVQDFFGDSVLFYALRYSKTEEFVKKILQFGGDVHHKNCVDENAAHVLFQTKFYDPELVLVMLILLEENGFQGFREKNFEGLTPYGCARKWGNIDANLKICLELSTYPCLIL